MESQVVSPRIPISELSDVLSNYSKEALAGLSRKFDMFRYVRSSSKTHAAKYAALEYLLRPTVRYCEFTSCFTSLPTHIRDGLQQEMMTRNPFTVLETLVRPEDLVEMPHPKILVKTYTVSEGKLTSQLRAPTQSISLPICYLFIVSETLIILYTPIMTVLDGFCPYSGTISKINTTRVVVERAKAELYKNRRAKTIEQHNLLDFMDNLWENDGLKEPEDRSTSLTVEPPKKVVIHSKSSCCEACRLF